jgi:hypothetical protein
MSNQGYRKHPALDVVKMMATLTREHWFQLLTDAAHSGNVDKLVAWRYGMQAGLSDAVHMGLSSEKLDIWVIKRCRNLEKCMRFILKHQYPNPMDRPGNHPLAYIKKAKDAKKKRDRNYEDFLLKSSF